MGLLNLVVPEEYGGPGLDSVTIAMIYEELGKGCVGVATSIAANALASYPILIAGNDEQKKYQCDLLNNGGLAAFALTEPDAGSDAGGVSTKAVKEGDHYVLNGSKVFITNGGIADSFLVFANTRKTGGIRGLTCFIVPKGTPGFSVGRKEDKMGIRPSNTCELILEDVVVPESMRVGREGQGFRIAMQTLDSARPFVASVAVGVAQSALDIAAHYARERRQFGQPISSFQLIQGMVADMAMKVHGARLMVQQACWMRDQGLEFGMEAAMSKCFASDVAMEVTTDAVQIMGGYGYMKDYPMERRCVMPRFSRSTKEPTRSSVLSLPIKSCTDDAEGGCLGSAPPFFAEKETVMKSFTMFGSHVCLIRLPLCASWTKKDFLIRTRILRAP